MTMDTQPTIQIPCKWENYKYWIYVPEEIRQIARRLDGTRYADVMLVRYGADGVNDMVPQWWYQVGSACEEWNKTHAP